MQARPTNSSRVDTDESSAVASHPYADDGPGIRPARSAQPRTVHVNYAGTVAMVQITIQEKL